MATSGEEKKRVQYRPTCNKAEGRSYQNATRGIIFSQSAPVGHITVEPRYKEVGYNKTLL